MQLLKLFEKTKCCVLNDFISDDLNKAYCLLDFTLVTHVMPSKVSQQIPAYQVSIKTVV